MKANKQIVKVITATTVLFGCLSVRAQSGAQATGCKKSSVEMSKNPMSISGALQRYVDALIKSNRQLISAYSARFVFDSKRRRVYRSQAEQEQYIEQMLKRPLLAFYFYTHFSSTAELKYPEAQRQYTILGCVDYLDEGVELSAGVVVIVYRNGRGWIFNPLLTPEYPFHLKQSEPKPVSIPMPSPPSGVAEQRLERTRRRERLNPKSTLAISRYPPRSRSSIVGRHASLPVAPVQPLSARVPRTPGRGAPDQVHSSLPCQ
jgi:hypothetical protein